MKRCFNLCAARTALNTMLGFVTVVLIAAAFSSCGLNMASPTTPELSAAPLAATAPVSCFPVQLEQYATKPYPAGLFGGEITLDKRLLAFSHEPSPDNLACRL